MFGIIKPSRPGTFFVGINYWPNFPNIYRIFWCSTSSWPVLVIYVFLGSCLLHDISIYWQYFAPGILFYISIAYSFILFWFLNIFRLLCSILPNIYAFYGCFKEQILYFIDLLHCILKFPLDFHSYLLKCIRLNHTKLL